jgi:subtilisin family serine protease
MSFYSFFTVAAITGLMLSGAHAVADERGLKTIQAPKASAPSSESVPVVVKYRDGSVRAMSGAGANGPVEFKSVPKSDLDVELQKLRMQENVEYAEPNYPVTKPKPVQAPIPSSEVPRAKSLGLEPGQLPNDPEFSDQYTWLDPTQYLKGQHSGLKAVQAASENYRVKVGVIDSEFRETYELRYAGGYNFARIDGPVGPEYLEEYYDPSCTTSHGTAVANIIGAPTNNGRGMAGFVNADVYVARSMRCGSGFLYDTAEAIRWMAGDPTLTNAPAIGVDIDIINLSLGSQAICPAYLQDAINYAYAKGITVVAAAGNDAIDVSGYSPASCNHVLTVASTSRYGKQSSFTNFGDEIDVAALGEMVLSMIKPGETAYHYGTSFSAPNVAGMAALIKQSNPFLGPDDIASRLRSTAVKNPQEPGAQIGEGMVRPAPVVQLAADQYESEKPTLTHVLEDPARCNSEAYKALLPKSVKPCQLYEVNASDLAAKGYRYVVFEAEAAGALNASEATPVEVSQEAIFVVSGLEATGKRYGLGLCDAGGNNCAADALYPLGEGVLTDQYCN